MKTQEASRTVYESELVDFTQKSVKIGAQKKPLLTISTTIFSAKMTVPIQVFCFYLYLKVILLHREGLVYVYARASLCNRITIFM
jgi:hypothetical protein